VGAAERLLEETLQVYASGRSKWVISPNEQRTGAHTVAYGIRCIARREFQANNNDNN
jgi:hypothetical protein